MAPRRNDGKSYQDRNREEMAERSREKSASNRDIGELPPIKNQAARDDGGRSLKHFARHYFPATFSLPFSPDHDAVIAKIELAVTKGGLFALAMPRGSGKTTLCEVAAIWSILYGYHKFIVMVGSDIDAAVQMLNSIKVELESNDILGGDFPEVCYPIEQLEGEPRRCKGQTYKGERTQSQWSDKTIVLPTIAGSNASAAIIRTAGITGKVRGLKFKRPDGESVRPTLVLVDDPQTDDSANSVSQCQTRERTLSGAVLGLAGPGKRIAGIMPCTVIREGDLADRMLDVKSHPEWNGSRFQLMYEFPKNRDLWDEYKSIMGKFSPDIPGDRERAFSDATAYYLDHSDAMDEGARVAWAERYDPQELSAVQHCMNLLLRDERAFWAEYQNRPLPEVVDSPNAIKPDDVLIKLNGSPRGVVPVQCNQLTAFVDVQGDALFWLVAGWSQGFGGCVIDYGSYPDQKTSYFTLQSLRYTLSSVVGGNAGASIEHRIRYGLDAVAELILARDWPRADGSMLRVERCLVDANWGESTPIVRKFCRESKQRSVLFPSHGRGIGASSVPIGERKAKEGERVGLNWFISLSVKASVRQVIYDTNFWKSFAALRIKSGMGQQGTLTLFGDSRDTHKMIADHWSCETPERVKAERTGRTVDEWRAPPSAENHWWDCYSSDMETLTRNGWRYFSELTGSEEIATVNLGTDTIEYQLPTELVSRSYVGEMVQIGGGPYSRLDMLVTPTHRMVIYAGQNSQGPVIREAKNITIWDKIKTAAKWKGNGVYEYEIPASIKYPRMVVPADVAASFFGWYISEGSCFRSKGNYRVVISQIGGRKADKIRCLLEKLPWAFHQGKQGFVISNRQAYDLVVGLGNRDEKYVPQWIKDSPTDVISAYIESAVDGDGWRDRNSESYATVSKRLADDMAELWLKSGYAVSLRTRQEKQYSIRGRIGLSRQQYYVHRKSTNWCLLRDSSNNPNFSRVHYDGMVYCASVPNGTLIVRRNGKIAVCGNCLVGACVGASIQGLSLDGVHQASRPRRKVNRKTFAELELERTEKRNGGK